VTTQPLVETQLLLNRLTEDPDRAAIFLDVDGVLAPIVDVPADACVPDETRAELERLRDRYGLVACVSGRSGADAERIVGVPGLAYVGEHGLELVPDAPAWGERLHQFAATIDWDDVELKPITVSFHYRRAPDEDEAVKLLVAVATRAEQEGFDARFGRKILEVRPPIHANKGTAITHLLAERGLRRALFAGDDTTDLDGFRALEDLEVAVRVAVSSSEAPSGLAESADIVVGSPRQFLDLLRRL
jgi:trehalose 6-phosphate phosphatase